LPFRFQIHRGSYSHKEQNIPQDETRPQNRVNINEDELGGCEVDYCGKRIWDGDKVSNEFKNENADEENMDIKQKRLDFFVESSTLPGDVIPGESRYY